MIYDVEQRTPEWDRLRLGKLTASRMGDATAKLRDGKTYGATRANYMAELVCERLTQTKADRYVSREMLYGTEQEPNAIAAYEWKLDVVVQRIGFITHPEIENTGGSPDGAIGDDGLVEVKSPNSAQHIRTILTKVIDGEYMKQMQWLMACSGRAYCDFVTWDMRMPLDLRIWVLRVMRNDVMIAELEREARLFLAELDEQVEALRAIAVSGHT